MRDKITLKSITVQELENFSTFFRSSLRDNSVVPIPPIRALAHSRNPCAVPGDVALLVACHDNRCLGYYGLLPGYLVLDGMFRKIYWSSTFYVAEPARGLGIGQELVRGILALNQDILVCGVSPKAKNILRISGYHEVRTQTHCQLRLDRIKNLQQPATAQNARPISRQSEEGKPAEIEKSPRLYQDLKKHFYQQVIEKIPEHSSSIRFQAVDRLENFQETEKKQHPYFYRGTDVINWMLQYKWIHSRDEMTGATAGAETAGYHFSAVKDIHKYFCFTFHGKADNQYFGFLVFSVSRRHGTTRIKILDHSLSCRGAAWSAYRLTFLSAQEYLADRIDIPTDLVQDFTSLELPAPLIKRQSRTVFYHPKKTNSVVGSCIDRIQFDYCDGDGPFT